VYENKKPPATITQLTSQLRLLKIQNPSIMSSEIQESPEQIIKVGAVDICTSTFGSSANSAIVLLAGGAGSMLFWDEEFCQQLAAGNHFVVRLDQRDTGRSTTYPPGSATYTSRDFADDVLGVMDHFKIQKAHFVTFSLGGLIAQILSEENPDRVATLTQISSSPVGPYKDEPDLAPAPKENEAKFIDIISKTDFSKRDDAVQGLVKFSVAGASPAQTIDIAKITTNAERVFDRTTNIMAAFANHGVLAHKRWPREKLKEIKVPSLIIHGEDDPLIPLPHGVALSKEIPGAELLVLKGVGHAVPENAWPIIVPAILEHTKSE
jgi:pimeloyl-ACP methyl ester carboxylesterase